jgi:hypothetical protein
MLVSSKAEEDEFDDCSTRQWDRVISISSAAREALQMIAKAALIQRCCLRAALPAASGRASRTICTPDVDSCHFPGFKDCASDLVIRNERFGTLAIHVDFLEPPCPRSIPDGNNSTVVWISGAFPRETEESGRK